jgi:hypothetical protein
MLCSEPMAVTAVVPHEAVANFAYEDLHCLACGATERRLIFERQPNTSTDQPDAKPPPVGVVSPSGEPVISIKGQPESSCAPREDECPLPNPLRAAPAWARAVEKVRSRQADLHARAEEAKKADCAAQFNRAWEKLAPTAPEPAPPLKAMQERAWSRRALRAQMRKLSRPTSRKQPQEPVFEANPEVFARFNRFWESLVGGANIVSGRPDNSPPRIEPAPLPRYLSLVPVESFNTLETLQSMNDTTRALLLLAGPQRPATHS